MIKAVLFDLDGTLLDTSEGIMDSVRYTIDTLGYSPLPSESLLKFVGPPIQNSLMTQIGLSSEEAQKGATIFRDYYKSKALFKAKVYSGIIDILEYLNKNDILIGVATYKREDYAIDLLKFFKIAEYCNVIHGADNYNQLTKADIVELCVSELGVAKEEMVLIGDTEHDAKGAKGAGIKFIAVTWGFGYKQGDSINYSHIGIVNSTDCLINLLKEI